MAVSSSSSTLPSDIIFNILTRTSLKTVDTCKAISKEWHDLIFESSFMPQFCATSQNISGYFVQSESRTKGYVTEFVSMDGCSGNAPFHLPIDDEQVKPPRTNNFDFKILASTRQGLLCCVRRVNRYYRYFVCKPSTRQWLILPNPRTSHPTVKVALIVLRSSPLHFKIIRLSSPKTLARNRYWKLGLCCYRCETFDSECWQWRKGKDLLFPPELQFDPYTPAVHAGGLIYFELRDAQEHQVMALNYDGKKAFPRFCLPIPPFDEHKGYYPSNRLVEYKGKLGFTCLSPKGMKLWVFENGKRVWLLNKEVGIERVKEVAKFPSPVGFYNADIALISESFTVIFYKLQGKSFNSVKLKKCHTAQEIFPFQSDLEPIHMPRANIVSSTKHRSLSSLWDLLSDFLHFSFW